MNEEYTWKTKYVWYVVTDEGRMVHPGGECASWRNCTLSELFDNEHEAILGLQQFYGESHPVYDNHILQKVYVKLWGG